jgi:hypothetical protein
MKKYKFITIDFIEGANFDGQPVYEILNNKSNDRLGILFYYKPWKCYTAEFKQGCIFNKECLGNIIDFIENHIKEIK